MCFRQVVPGGGVGGAGVFAPPREPGSLVGKADVVPGGVECVERFHEGARVREGVPEQGLDAGFVLQVEQDDAEFFVRKARPPNAVEYARGCLRDGARVLRGFAERDGFKVAVGFALVLQEAAGAQDDPDGVAVHAFSAQFAGRSFDEAAEDFAQAVFFFDAFLE